VLLNPDGSHSICSQRNFLGSGEKVVDPNPLSGDTLYHGHAQFPLKLHWVHSNTVSASLIH
jgi:hypothetical protein